MKSRRSFTILEITIALMILAFIGAVSAMQVKKLIDFHRFESEASLLYIALQEAQVLSATYQTDIALDFLTKNKILYYRFSSDEPFKPYQFDPVEKPISHIAKMTFQNQNLSRLHFDLYSGRIEPCGILSFAQSNKPDSKTLWLDLQYGCLTKFCSVRPLALKSQPPVKPSFPKS